MLILFTIKLIEGLFTYNAILVLDVQHSDLTVLYIMQCLPC